jgi:hypothetical protein
LALPSIALGVLSLLAFARVARRVVPEAGRVPWALAFFAVSPWLGGMSNYLRPYAVALCLALVATAAALECLDSRPRGAARVVFVVASALGLYTIYPYAFVLLWHGVLLTAALWRRPREERKREFLVLGAMAGCIALAYAPWLPRLALHVAGADDPEWYFSGALPLAAWPQQAWVTLRTFFLGEKFGGALPRWGLVALAIATAPLVLRAFRSAGRASLDPTARLFWAAAPVLPLLILASDALRGTHMLVATKLNFACLPLLLLLVARACAAAPRPVWRAGLASAWLALLLGTSLANIALHARLTVSAELLARKIAGEPHDGEWFVLSSARWGFVYPTLLSWRDAGVRGGALLVASQAELPALLARAHDDPDVRGVLLIGLSSGWRNDGAWQADELQRLAAERLAAGWQVGAGPAGPAGKRLRVAPDVYPYFYSM